VGSNEPYTNALLSLSKGINDDTGARHANRSWSEIEAMLGVSKQAVQRKDAAKISA
jgi:hypothetical protein